MKKLLKTMRVLLVAAGLCVGASAWADDVTQTIDFKTFTASSTPDIQLDETAIAQSGTNALTVYKLTNTGFNHFDRIALSHTNKSAVQKRWMFRNGSNAYQYGLCGNWNGGGTANTSYNISILDLHAGDRVTFSYQFQNTKSAQPMFCSAGVVTSGSPATDNTAESALASGTTYTMKADGNLDLYVTDNNLGIYTITIVTSHVAESIDTDPTISVSGANNGDRQITISSSKTNTGSDTETYYTKDGSTPTASSTKYTDAFDVTSSDIVDGKVTIKAITYKTGDTSVASGVTTFEVPGVGTTIKLANPIIALTGMTQAGEVYNPTYAFTSDATGTYGSPSITLTATFNGTAIDAASYTATATGTISVVASATGYENSDAAEVTVTGVGYNLLKSIDVASFYPGVSGEWPDGLDYDQIPGLTIDPVNLTQGCTYRTTHNSTTYNAYYGRNKGFTVTCSGLTDDMLVVLENYDRSKKFVITETNNSAWIDKDGSFKYYYLYVLPGSNISISVSEAGMATYVNNAFDLDFSSSSIEAYKVKVSTKGVATLTKVENVPAGTPVLLVKDGGATEDIPVMTGAAAVSDNDLVAGTGVAVATNDGEYTNMILNNVDGNVGFYFAAGQTVAANRAYLHIASTLAPDAVGTSRMVMVFDGEATGINAMVNENGETDKSVYTLSGQRISQPTKGLYIVNGKKIIVK